MCVSFVWCGKIRRAFLWGGGVDVHLWMSGRFFCWLQVFPNLFQMALCWYFWFLCMVLHKLTCKLWPRADIFCIYCHTPSWNWQAKTGTLVIPDKAFLDADPVNIVKFTFGYNLQGFIYSYRNLTMRFWFNSSIIYSTVLGCLPPRIAILSSFMIYISCGLKATMYPWSHRCAIEINASCVSAGKVCAFCASKGRRGLSKYNA